MKVNIIVLIFLSVLLALLSIALPRRYVYAPEGESRDLETRLPEKKTSLLFVGDIMLGRNVETLMREKGDDYPFSRLGDLFTRYEAVVANIEGPILEQHIPTPNFSTKFSFASTTASLLRDRGVDIVMLGNNHTFDFGESGYQETKQHFKYLGVQYAGHPFDISHAYSLRTVIGSYRFTFISFNATYPTFNYKRAVELVYQERASSLENFIVVEPHWGNEYELLSNVREQRFAHDLVDAGADIVIGHHPHVAQEIETYKGKLIFYSLGNFIFDQYFSEDVEQGLAIGLTFEDESIRIDLIPIQSERSRPREMNRDEKSLWLDKLSKRSDSEIKEAIQSGIIVISR